MYSGSGGFSAFASVASKSFKDLLQTEKDEPGKDQAAVTATKDEVARLEETKPQPKSSKDLEGESSYIEILSSSQVADEIDNENLPPTPSTHSTFGEEEDKARRSESAEIVVRDDTADFCPILTLKCRRFRTITKKVGKARRNTRRRGG